MIKKRDAQGMSINVIVLAAIALIILVIVVAVLSGKFGLFTGTTDKVTSCRSICGNFDKGHKP